MVGGESRAPVTNAYVNLDTVYKFEPETEAWLLMPQRLNRPKHRPVAFNVAPEEFPKCN